MSKEAMKLALEALENTTPTGFNMERDKQFFAAITALREKLAEQPAQPVAHPEGDIVGPCICGSWPGGKCLKCPRITAPAQRTWVGLTDEEIDLFINGKGDEDDEDYVEPTGDGFGLTDADLVQLVRKSEAKLKEKNT